tara:strand:+ start:708 stop:1886 length:1179 start_codon:yes stop_codon:yes gene_type:complete
MNRAKIYFLLGCLVAAVGCQTIAESSYVKPGVKPELKTTEAGLWMHFDRMEQKVKTSGMLVTDKKLNSYMQNLVCKLAGEYCPDIRVYTLKVPQFNASMASNGMMQVWTGLLLRVQNESQLAAVLGHEITHYTKKHSLKRAIDIKNKGNFLAVFNVALAGAGTVYGVDTRGLSDLTQLGLIGSIQAYSRDHEREADAEGLDLLMKLGYAAEGAPEIWENMIGEQEAGDKSSGGLFLASHPAPEERIKNLREKAKEKKVSGTPKIGEKKFLENVLPHRSEWFLHELEHKKFAEMDFVLKNLAFSPLHKGELHFLRGELIRKKADEAYIPKAISQYQKSIELDPSDPRPRKSIGLLLMKTDQKQLAAENLEKYIALKPDAEDILMIKKYIEQLR